MKKRLSKNIFIGAGILAIAGIVSRAIGAVYKIPLTNTLGANGMGVYYLIFPFYSLLLVLSVSFNTLLFLPLFITFPAV